MPLKTQCIKLRVKEKYSGDYRTLDTRNVEYLLRKIIGNEKNRPKRKAMRAANSNATGTGLPKSF